MIKYKYLIFLLVFNINCLKITRAILTWDNHPNFNYFWPIVSKAWASIGIRPTLVFIGPKTIKLDNTYGDVLYFQPLKGVPTPFQATTIRPLIAALYANDVCILTDLDMLPLSKAYFEKAVRDVPQDNFAVFYPNYYRPNNSRYMMCYNVAKGSTFAEVFQITGFEDVYRTIYSWFTSFYHIYAMTTDEHMLYKYLNNWNQKETRLSLLNVKFARLNREKWTYKQNQIKKGLLADAHLPRPFLNYKNEINELLKLIEINNV